MTKHSPVEQYSVDLLLAGLVFGEFNCPPQTAKSLVEKAFKGVEQNSWMPHRKELLGYVIEEARSVRVNAAVTAKLESWFPVRATLRASTIRNMKKWPLTADVSDALWHALHDEEIDVQRSAARTLAHLANGNQAMGYKVEQLATVAVDPLVRAAAVECLFLGWPQSDKLDEVLSAALMSLSPELCLVAIMGKIALGTQTEADRDMLLNLIDWSLHMDYQWYREITPTLLRGWPGDAKLKGIFLSIARDKGGRHLDKDDALRFLIAGYPQDDDVVRLIIERLSDPRKRIFLHEFGLWSQIAENFGNNPALVTALDEFFDTIDGSQELSIAQAVMAGFTPKGKALLLNMLNNKRGAQHPARTLLQYWGMSDPEVADAIANLAFGPIEKATTISHLLSYVIPDPAVRRGKLLELLAGLPADQYYRLEWILKGLWEIGKVEDDKEALAGCLDYLARWPSDKGVWSGYVDLIGTIIRYFPHEQSVRALAIAQLGEPDGNHSTIADVYGSDPEIRQAILKILCPLPAELREVIAAQLGSGAIQEEYALNLLRLYDWDPDPLTKTQAAIAYFSRLKDSSLVTDDVLQTLRETINVTGPDLAERRQAAFCGLVALGRLDIMREVWQAQEKPYVFPLLEMPNIEQNILMFQFVLQHWKYINDTLGNQFSEWIVRDSLEFWEQTSPFLEEYSAPANQALSFLEKLRPRPIKGSLLNFLNRVVSKTKLVRDFCLATILEPVEDGISEDMLVATQILASDFKDDAYTLERLQAASAHEPLPDGVLIALCEG